MKVVSLIILSLFLNACVANKVKQDANSKPSEALQVVEAGGLEGLRDLTQADLKKAWKIDDSSNSQAAVRASMAAGTAMGIYSPPPGFSSSASTNLLTAGAILSFFKVNEAKYLHTFAWMPKSEASTSEDALKKLKKYFLTAYQKVLPKHQVSIVNEIIPGRKNKRPYRHIKIVGENCQPRCGAYGSIFTTARKPSLDTAPDFMGGQETWTWKKFTFTNPAFSACCGGYGFSEGGFKDEKQKFVFLSELTRHLPAWVYIYIPPKYGAGLPMVFNKGRQLLFVRQPK